MKLPEGLIRATLVRRYKRFLADVELADGAELTVHCPNPGAMRSCSEPGRPVLISDSGNPARKLRHTLEMIRMGRIWVGVNTARPNRAVASFVRAGRIPELAGYRELRAEVPYGEGLRSRIDLLLIDPAGELADCYVEVKNTTYRTPVEGEPGVFHAAFPDAVTERGRKHLNELERVVRVGQRGVMFFFVGRSDCHRFRPADEVDPAYGETLRRVAGSGVEVLAYRMRVSPRRIALGERLPVDL
jgi:sugar fermentation stimulation protein A